MTCPATATLLPAPLLTDAQWGVMRSADVVRCLVGRLNVISNSVRCWSVGPRSRPSGQGSSVSPSKLLRCTVRGFAGSEAL